MSPPRGHGSEVKDGTVDGGAGWICCRKDRVCIAFVFNQNGTDGALAAGATETDPSTYDEFRAKLHDEIDWFWFNELPPPKQMP